MSKIEVEHRGKLTAIQYKSLFEFFKENAKFLETKKRFTIIYGESKKSVREVKDEPIDLKLRITNGQPEIALKYGKWSGKDARREFGFQIEPGKYDDFVEFLKILGYSKAVLMVITKHDFMYHGIEFSLAEVPEWGNYFEAEILTDEKNVEDAHKKLDQEVADLGLEVLGEEEFYDMLDELNNRPGYRVNLDDTTTQELREKFKEYF